MEFVLPVGDSFDEPYQQDTCKIANYSTRFYFFCGCGRFFNFFDDFWHYITYTMANSSTGYDCFRGYESLCKITNHSSTQQWVTFTNVYWSAVFYLRLSKLISCLFVHEASWVFPRAQFHSNLQFKWYSDNQHSFRTARLTREKHARTRLFVLRWKFQMMSECSMNVLLSLSFVYVGMRKTSMMWCVYKLHGSYRFQRHNSLPSPFFTFNAWLPTSKPEK